MYKMYIIYIYILLLLTFTYSKNHFLSWKLVRSRRGQFQIYLIEAHAACVKTMGIIGHRDFWKVDCPMTV